MLNEDNIQTYVDIVLQTVDQLLLWQPQSHHNDCCSADWCPYELGGVGAVLLFAKKQIVIFSPILDDYAMEHEGSPTEEEAKHRFLREIDHWFYVGEAFSGMHALYKTIEEPLFNGNLNKVGQFHKELEKRIYSAMIEKYSLSLKDGCYYSENGVCFILPSSAYKSSSGGCYIATAVYGSYDCPQVWTLRRFRDFKLTKSIYGRAFIKLYYAVSPTLVRWFGKTTWFNRLWRCRLDKMVEHLHENGYADTPYND